MIMIIDNLDIQQLDRFNKVLKNCLNDCAPIITKLVGRSYAPWIIDEVRLEMNARNDFQRGLKTD